ncbi:hypothetical protein C8J57DRAFT_1350059 [Mycena rebaudengoi]|nr:hypothetical protein C8J57DRAFT_1350059 [Mycena rebaudengoi]
MQPCAWQAIPASFAAISVALNSVGVGARNRITTKTLRKVSYISSLALAVGTCSAAIGVEDNRGGERGEWRG